MNMGNKDPSRRLEIVRKAAPTSAKPSAVRRCLVVAAGAVVVVVVALLVWGYAEGMRVPRTKHVGVTISRLGSGLDGLRVAMITDTHFGPIDRTRWSAAVADRINELDADIVCHVGDLADGTVDMREEQGDAARSGEGQVRSRVRHWQP
jgi:predicted MPP superfamily phosphohydrolase